MSSKGKRRGPGRPVLNLGGQKRLEKATKRKLKRKIHRDMDKAGIKPKVKTRIEKAIQEAPVSVLFVENTKNSMLAKRLQAAQKRLAGSTSYRIRITETARMALSRLLPITNPWGAGDCQR